MAQAIMMALPTMVRQNGPSDAISTATPVPSATVPATASTAKPTVFGSTTVQSVGSVKISAKFARPIQFGSPATISRRP